MISNKKSYAMKMLQLALALSLLHVDPDNYIQQRLQGWDSQLELRDGDGWELEMLRAVPMVEYPYANRKSMMPLIEDLILFDRQYEHNNPYNVTAFVLNVHNESTIQTSAMQELQTTTGTSSANGAASSAAAATAAVVAGAAALEQVASATASNGNSSVPSSELELFLNSEHFNEHRSIWEQNLADLNDFGDFPLPNFYANLPLKNENTDNTFLDVNLGDLIGMASRNHQQTETAVALNDTTPNPSDAAIVKLEQFDNDDDDDNLLFGLFDNVESDSNCDTNTAACIIKTEETDDTLVKIEDGVEDYAAQVEVDLSPFIIDVELSDEESEIVEVLWKQDVDLGYSLNPEQLLDNATTGGVNDNDPKISTKNSSASDDDIEKLKALEELKQDKSKYDEKDANTVGDIVDDWNGVPFTIDNETGEYIRLPLDDLLNDVLQLTANLGEEDDEIDNDPIASTSKAAAAANKLKFESGDDNVDNDKKSNGSKSQNNDKASSSDSEDDENDLSDSDLEISSLPSPLFDLDDEAKRELDTMLQSPAPPYHHHHHAHHHHRPGVGGVQPNYATVGSGANSAFHRQTSTATGFHHGHHQGRMPLSRNVSMEQRLQDIASFFNPIPSMGDMPPYPHYPSHHYSYQGATAMPPQHAQYGHPPPPPPPHHHGHHAMLHPNAPLGDICATQPHYGHNLGSAVSSSMHLTNSSHEADAATGGASNVGAYKMEHEMMYYSNASTDINHTTDGFINSILNDEDLHLMDMNVTDPFCRMVDVNNSTSNNSSILGLPSSGHGSNGGSSAASAAGAGSALALNGGSSVGAVGMTADLLNVTGAQGGGGGSDRLDASSDSAVSSMGSERVPSLSDGEWGEGSDSAQDYHQGKYGGPFDYSYNTNTRIHTATRQPPVAQKKHQMFGKRYLNEPPVANAPAVVPPTNNAQLCGPTPSIKYEYEPYPTVPSTNPTSGLQHNAEAGAMGPILNKEHQHAYDVKYANNGGGAMGGYSIDFSLRTPRTPHDIVQHNHTYTLPQGTGSLPRPQLRDKAAKAAAKHAKALAAEEEHLTRDEKRARSLNIPITVSDIINLPMDEFNERLSKYDLSENQLSLIRDIRRRGKNKVAAQNCRKRKLDQILTLEDEVNAVRKRKDQLQQDREMLFTERKRISNKFAALHRHIFQYLRDPEGNPCSPSEYSLQQAADGSIYLLPRDNKADGNNTTSVSGSSSATSNTNGIVSTHHGHLAAATHNLHTQQQQQQQSQQHAMQTQTTLAQHHTNHIHHQQQQLQQQQQQQHQQQHQQQQQQQHQHHPTQQKD